MPRKIKLKKGRKTLSKVQFPNMYRAASDKGKGNGDYRPGWEFAERYLKDNYPNKTVTYLGSRKGSWAFHVG